MAKITEATVLKNYRLAIAFDDGASGEVDLSEMVGKGVFSFWCDPNFFKEVRIDSFGELAWGDKIDLCADFLYIKITGKKPEDIFPALRNESIHA